MVVVNLTSANFFFLTMAEPEPQKINLLRSKNLGVPSRYPRDRPSSSSIEVREGRPNKQTKRAALLVADLLP